MMLNLGVIIVLEKRRITRRRSCRNCRCPRSGRSWRSKKFIN